MTRAEMLKRVTGPGERAVLVHYNRVPPGPRIRHTYGAGHQWSIDTIFGHARLGTYDHAIKAWRSILGAHGGRQGRVETPAAGSGRVGTAAWSNLPPYHNATRYTPSPASHQPLSSNSGQRPGSIAPHLLQDQGERPWVCPRATFGAWATSVETTAALRLGGTHSGTLCTPPL
ncbi:hypothetical protein GWK47_037680 [Chionoecetes opilio]|uniref:Uncharacterized protein n=1 Tax=Chionoecetes opilio TaxID=41210 RepID=A0A8J5CMH2_CHIOP|nr:hypothetical protein GWK47_037680 [Chionoecetes opilio]